MTTNTEYNNKFKSHLGEGGSKAWKYCGMSGGPWCCAEVSLVAGETNKKLFYGGRKCTYCPTAMAYDKAHYARVPMYLAMGGDRIYFDWNGNGVPDHIGEVDYRISTDTIATVEGNTGSPARVRTKERPAKYVLGIYRPEYQPATMPKKEKLTVDGAFEFKSIYMLQLALGVKADCILGKGTVKALQKKAGVVPDGDWGAKTSRAVQKMVGAKVDGAFGKNSVMALQKWINTKVFGNASTSSKTPVTATKPSTPITTLKSHKIEVDLTNQICTVYGVYSDGSVKGIMSEFVSTARKGKTTPVGNFKIQGASGGRKAKYRTCKLSGGKTYAEYACRFKGAKMMHGVPWRSRNTKGYVYKNEFNKLGSVASGGCVRMPWKMAKYIYEKCPIGTPVKVFKGTKGKYPMGKPKKYTATKDIDPTYSK